MNLWWRNKWRRRFYKPFNKLRYRGHYFVCRYFGADFLVLADAWDKKNQGPPELMGQLFHYFESPNRFGLPAFYTLHVWAWKDNPNGAFVNWHPDVSCEQYSGRSF